MSAEEMSIAYHEAGHAVATWLYDYGHLIRRVSIVAEQDYLVILQSESPLTRMNPELDSAPEIIEALSNDVVILYSGPVAQIRHRPASWHNYHGAKDFADAAILVSSLGGSIETEENLHASLLEQAENLIAEYWVEVEAVAKALLDRQELNSLGVVSLLESLTGRHIEKSRLFDYQDPNSVAPEWFKL